jgi:hypothetical protein
VEKHSKPTSLSSTKEALGHQKEPLSKRKDLGAGQRERIGQKFALPLPSLHWIVSSPDMAQGDFSDHGSVLPEIPLFLSFPGKLTAQLGKFGVSPPTV